jgi:hypothetical protein
MKLIKTSAVLMLVAGFSSTLHASVVPELDPGSVMSAGMLLGGVLLVIRSRKK